MGPMVPAFIHFLIHSTDMNAALSPSLAQNWVLGTQWSGGLAEVLASAEPMGQLESWATKSEIEVPFDKS